MIIHFSALIYKRFKPKKQKNGNERLFEFTFKEKNSIIISVIFKMYIICGIRSVVFSAYIKE